MNPLDDRDSILPNVRSVVLCLSFYVDEILKKGKRKGIKARRDKRELTLGKGSERGREG